MFNWFKSQKQKDEEWGRGGPQDFSKRTFSPRDIIEMSHQEMLDMEGGIYSYVPPLRGHVNFFRERKGLPLLKKGHIADYGLVVIWLREQVIEYLKEFEGE